MHEGISVAGEVADRPQLRRPAQQSFWYDKPLSARESQVLLSMAHGQTNPQIGSTLGISPATVRTHTEHIFQKLRAGGRINAVLRGFEAGAIRLEDAVAGLDLTDMQLRMDSLSPREREVLGLLSTNEGASSTYEAITTALTVEVKTVKTHLEHIYSKLGITNRMQAALISIHAQQQNYQVSNTRSPRMPLETSSIRPIRLRELGVMGKAAKVGVTPVIMQCALCPLGPEHSSVNKIMGCTNLSRISVKQVTRRIASRDTLLSIPQTTPDNGTLANRGTVYEVVPRIKDAFPDTSPLEGCQYKGAVNISPQVSQKRAS